MAQAIREIKILRALDHPNIVQLKEMLIYDAGDSFPSVFDLVSSIDFELC